MEGTFIRLVLTREQIEELRNAEFVELRIESINGDVADKLYFYKNQNW